MIGLAGAHRTGKSTLARRFSEVSGIPFLQTSASGTFARLGLDPKKDYPFAVRLDIQRNILDDCEKVYRSIGVASTFITDRTPLDMLAYTLADVQRENVDGALAGVFESYVKDCYEIANAHFPIVVILQPGIPLVEAEGKAPANPLYIEHINSLVLGAVTDERFKGNHFYIPRKETTLEGRVKCVDYCLSRTVQRHETWRKSMEESGMPIIEH